MELALLVYAISLLEPIKMLAIILLASTFAPVFFGLIIDQNAFLIYKYVWTRYVAGLLFVLSVFTIVLIPQEKTAYMMVGAYAAQKVYENPTTERLSNKVIQSIEGKLDFYIAEAEKEASEKIKEKINGN